MSDLISRILLRRNAWYWLKAGITLDDAIQIRDRKSIWMKLYLEERRGGTASMRGFFRCKHFAALKAMGRGRKQ